MVFIRAYCLRIDAEPHHGRSADIRRKFDQRETVKRSGLLRLVIRSINSKENERTNASGNSSPLNPSRTRGAETRPLVNIGTGRPCEFDDSPCKILVHVPSANRVLRSQIGRGSPFDFGTIQSAYSLLFDVSRKLGIMWSWPRERSAPIQVFCHFTRLFTGKATEDAERTTAPEYRRVPDVCQKSEWRSMMCQSI
jgi:hypothetical protein